MACGAQGLEQQHLVTRVPALFNRLTVFDPRFPHGVKQVHGTRDPRKGRLVLHGAGWGMGCCAMPMVLLGARHGAASPWEVLRVVAFGVVVVAQQPWGVMLGGVMLGLHHQVADA